MTSAKLKGQNMEVTSDNSVSLIRPEGNLDSNTAQAFEASLLDVTKSHSTNVLIDLEKVNFIASAGLRVLLNITKCLAKHDRTLRVFGVNGLVREVFEVSGFISIIDVREDEADARTGL